MKLYIEVMKVLSLTTVLFRKEEMDGQGRPCLSKAEGSMFSDVRSWDDEEMESLPTPSWAQQNQVFVAAVAAHECSPSLSHLSA